MKKHFVLFFILFAVGALSAQNLNFRDTNGLKTLLCSKHWIRYNINADSSFSESISDSIVFNVNGTFHKSAEHKISTVPDFVHDPVFNGTWHLGSAGTIIANSSSTHYIYVVLNISRNKVTKSRVLLLIDGYRLKGSKVGKITGNIDEPFLAWWDTTNGLKCSKYEIWQAHREFKEATSRNH